jgi:hypothetical protein
MAWILESTVVDLASAVETIVLACPADGTSLAKAE